MCVVRCKHFKPLLDFRRGKRKPWLKTTRKPNKLVMKNIAKMKIIAKTKNTGLRNTG